MLFVEMEVLQVQKPVMMPILEEGMDVLLPVKLSQTVSVLDPVLDPVRFAEILLSQALKHAMMEISQEGMDAL